MSRKRRSKKTHNHNYLLLSSLIIVVIIILSLNPPKTPTGSFVKINESVREEENYGEGQTMPVLKECRQSLGSENCSLVVVATENIE